MLVSLEVSGGPSAGRRIDVRDGQVARFGSTEWADYSFPDDSEMLEVHFSLHCSHQACLLRSAHPTGPTLVNGQAVENTVLRPGDEIRAGRTTFAVSIDGADTDTENLQQDGDQPLPSEPEPPSAADELVTTCQYLELPDDVQEAAAGSPSADQFLQSLVDAEQFAHAIRWQSHALPKEQAVQWACKCVGETVPDGMSEIQHAAYEAAQKWAEDPTEEHRRAAETAADRAQYEGVGGMLAAAAFWSGGSLAPPNQEEVPPDDRLTGQAVTAALLMAAVEGDPAQASARFRRFLDMA